MIKLIKSTFHKEESTKKKIASFILRSKKLSIGEECDKFEKAFAKKQGRKYAVLVNSGSSANLILIQALLNMGRLKKEDVVMFSALTWATNVMPLIKLGLTPLGLDCELETLNVSSSIVKQSLNRKPKALFLTNVLGFGGDLSAIRKLCKKENIILLEDNCEALGSRIDGINLGNLGLASTFSFFVGHHMSTIEGGMVCTDDEELHEMLIMTRAHGWDRNLPEHYKKRVRSRHDVDEFFAKYTFYDVAYNVRPTEITGYIGNIQLPYWNTIVKIREKQYKHFAKVISNNSDFLPIDTSHMDIISNFAVPVICRDVKTFKRYRAKFEKADVEIRPIIAGDITRQPFYKKYVAHRPECTNTALIHETGFYFGNNPDMTKGEIATLSKLLTKDK